MPADYWGCLRIRAGHDRMAVHCLTTVAGYTIYRPQFLDRAIVRGRKADVPKALFPGYCFVLIVGGQWSRAAHMPGVLTFVKNGNGDAPAVVPEHVITELRRRERDDGYVHLPKPRGLQKGDAIYIRRGPLEGLRGLYVGQSSAQRVHVLLQLLSGPRRVEVPRGDVVAV